MKTNNFTSNTRGEKLKVKTEKEKEENNDENEEEEEEEEDEKSKPSIQKSKTSIRQPVNKDIKKTILKREDKSKILSQLPGKQRILYHHNQNPENDNQEGSIIRKITHEKKSVNPGMTAASRILAKKEILKTESNHPYSIRISKNSTHYQLKNPNPHNSTELNIENSQTEMEIKSKNPSKIENSSKTTFHHSKYTKRVVESSIINDEDSKEIKIINKSNNYTINVTNNNNTINVTNNNNDNNNKDATLNKNLNNERTKDINSNTKEEDEDEKEEVNIERKEPEYKSRKEPRRDIKKEIRRDKKEVDNNDFNIKEKEKKINEKEREIISSNIVENKREIHVKNNNIINKEKEENLSNNKDENENEKENMEEKVLSDGRREYVSNDIMIQNGVEILKFSPEETQKVLDKKAEAEEMRKKYKYYRQSNYNKSNDYFDSRRFRVFYQRGRDNFSKRNNFERDNFNRKDNNLDKSFEYYEYNQDYNNKTFNLRNNFNNNMGDFRYNNPSRKFYDRGKPHQISRGFMGRRGRY